MNSDCDSNRRSEPRHYLRAAAILERKSGKQVQASTINVSGRGVLLDIMEAADLAIGEEVACRIQLYHGKPAQSWGSGRIVRLDHSRVAIEFTSFDELPISPA